VYYDGDDDDVPCGGGDGDGDDDVLNKIFKVSANGNIK
jgi:hypothetical protein